MIETWNKNIASRLGDDAEMIPVVEKAISVKRFRKDKKEMAQEQKRLRGKI